MCLRNIPVSSKSAAWRMLDDISRRRCRRQRSRARRRWRSSSSSTGSSERPATGSSMRPHDRAFGRRKPADPGETACVSAGAAGGGVTEEPARCSHRLALRNWVALTRYTQDGRLKIDNNGAEQALRPIVLGRKNWLFAGSEAAAHRTAILCSLVQTCKCRSTLSCTLRDVIERVSTHPAPLIRDLRPREWQRRCRFRRKSCA